MNWADGQDWEVKFEKLLKRIDELLAEGHKVALVGASAGGSAAINAYAARPQLIGVVLIAGKVNRPGAVGEKYKRKNPAFWQSVLNCQSALKQLSAEQLTRIQSRYGIADELVPKADSIIPGADNKQVPIAGHFIIIAVEITFGAPGFIRFLKRKSSLR